MKASESVFQTFYLRWAGLVSAVLGLASFFLLVLAYREDNPSPQLLLGIFGLVGSVVSYAIGKDIMDRIRNREANATAISNQQARYAYIGTRVAAALSRYVLYFVVMTSLIILLLPYIDKLFLLCSNSPQIASCMYEATGMEMFLWR